MSVSKMKSLILLILALTAGFLLALVVPAKTLQQRQSRELHEKLEALFAQYEITLEGDSLPESAALYTVEPESGREQTAMKALLGDAVRLAESSTRYESRYVSEQGECVLSYDGRLDAVLVGAEAVRDPEADVQKRLRGMMVQAAETEYEEQGETAVVRIRQQLLGVPVLTEGLEFRYESGRLTAISGTAFFGTDTLIRTSEQTAISCADALVRFLSCRDSLGWVGSRISGMEQGFLPVETASSGIRFTPVWRIETDTGAFLVNGMSREVVPE